MKIMCDNCGKRPAKMFRRVHKHPGGSSPLQISSSPDHPLCRQCHDANFESQRQARYAIHNSDRAGFADDASLIDIGTLLRGYAFNFSDEKQLQQGIADVLDLAGIVFEREVALTGRDRIDFLMGTTGMEVKIGFSYTDVIRQLHRYAACERITDLILVTTRTLHVMPEEINGKRLETVNLGYTNSL